jgi:hypothetical protein
MNNMNNQMGMPPAAPKKNNNTVIIVVVVLVLCCCCLAVASVGGWFCGDWMMGAADACTF